MFRPKQQQQKCAGCNQVGDDMATIGRYAERKTPLHFCKKGARLKPECVAKFNLQLREAVSWPPA